MMVAKFRAKIRGLFRQRTGNLAESITALRKSDDGPYIQISPQGVHHQYRSPRPSKRKPTFKRKNAHASEVGFILEYGDGHHKATHWMETTIDENAEEIGRKMQEGFDALCDRKGVGL